MSQDKFLTWGSFIGSPEWIKKKKTRINPKNTDYKRCCVINHEEIKKDPPKISKNKFL